MPIAVPLRKASILTGREKLVRRWIFYPVFWLVFCLVICPLCLLFSPVALTLYLLAKSSQGALICRSVCPACSHPLGRQAIRLGNARWKAAKRENNRIKERTVHAVCPVCAAEYGYVSETNSVVPSCEVTRIRMSRRPIC